MDYDSGCREGRYMLPGCFEFTEVYWDSGLKLDHLRMEGPDAWEKYLSCNRCETDDRYVSIPFDSSVEIDTDVYWWWDYDNPDYVDIPDTVKTTSPVRCDSCQFRYDGCSSCGTFGESCLGCYSTHLLEEVASGVPCTRCSYWMARCISCTSSTSCRQFV